MHTLSGKRSLIALTLLGLSGVAQAHTLGLPHMDFAAGLAHPLGGLDHLLAMVAVGLWAAQRGGRALWLVPLTFVLTMAVGGLLGFLGIALPGVELGIAGSVLILGLLVALASRLSLVASMGLVGLFALFHAPCGTALASCWRRQRCMLAVSVSRWRLGKTCCGSAAQRLRPVASCCWRPSPHPQSSPSPLLPRGRSPHEASTHVRDLWLQS